MRVLFLTHRLPYAPNRGDRIRAYYLLREMSRFAEVSLFSLVHGKDEAAALEHVPFATRTVGSRVRRVPNLARGVRRRRLLARMVADHPPDVMVSFCSGMARFCLEEPLRGRPFVLDMVDVDSAKWGDLSRTARWPMRWIYAREARALAAFEIAATRSAATTLVVNHRERETLLALSPHTHVEVVENGIDLDAFRPTGSPSAGGAVVFCGVLNYQPNAEGLEWFTAQVWPLVRAHRPNARLVIVGDGAGRGLRQLAAGDSSVTLTGPVPLVQPYLWQGALAVAPLKIARGVQNKVLESLAAGLPCVVTSAVWNGLPEEAKVGTLVADEASTFASAVVSLLDQTPGERRSRAWTKHLDDLQWENRLRRMEDLLREAASSRGNAGPIES